MQNIVNLKQTTRILRDSLFSDFIAVFAGLGGSVGCASDWRPGGCGFDPR